MGKNRGTFLNVSGIMLFTVLGQMISFGREAVFAAYFGITYQADAYVIATQIPITLYAVVGVGITTAFLPMYTQKLKREGIEQADYFLNNATTVFVIIAVLFSILGIVFAKQAVFLFAPSYSGELQQLAILLTRIAFPCIIFTSLFNILKSVHNARESFFIPVIATNIQSIVIILAILLLGNQFGVLAATVSMLIALAIQVVVLQITIKQHYKWRPLLNLSDPDLKKICKLIGPIILGVGIAEINVAINRALATGLSEGSVAALNYSAKLVNVFSGLLASGIGIVCYQKLSALFAERKIEDIRWQLNKFLSILCLIALPITSGLVLLNEEIVTIVFGRGVFTMTAVQVTSHVCVFYAMGLLFVVMREIVSKTYYAMNDTKTPMINSAIGVCINIVLNLVLIRYLGAAGLALAMSISSAIICLLLFLNVRKKFEKSNFRPFFITLLKSIIATAGMCLILVLVPQFENVWVRTLSCTILGGVVYYLLLMITKTDEVVRLTNRGLSEVKKMIINRCD
jgi:putative peptidoglycan lipid II flippase